MLSDLELNLYRLFRDVGCKFGITITVEVLNDSDQIQDELATASWLRKEEIYRRVHCKIGVGFDGSPCRFGLGENSETADPAVLLGITPDRYKALTDLLAEAH